MRTRHLAALIALAMPVLAQTQATMATEATKSEKLWKIQTSGLSG